MNSFSCAYGQYELERYPTSSDPNLQAWEAADRYLLAALAEQHSLVSGPTAICNDQFGGLTTALHKLGPISWNDSALSHEAIAANLRRNGLDGPWQAVPSTESIAVCDGPLALVLVKVPKSLAFLEDQLARLGGLLSEKTVFVAASKAKHIHTSTLELFERYVGPTRTSLARQKARLIFVTPRGKAILPSPWPQTFEHEGRPVLGHAGVFSHRKLDIGTRVLLDELKAKRWAADADVVVDLGCGTGLLGLQAIQQNESLSCTFVDCSYLAVDSSQRNVRAWFPNHEQHTFAVANGLGVVGHPRRLVVEPRSVDLILCNPPFHDNYIVGGQTANIMFHQAAEALRPGGRLVVVANRHLRYQQTLRRIFESCEVVSSNRKFVVMVARRSAGPRPAARAS